MYDAVPNRFPVACEDEAHVELRITGSTLYEFRQSPWPTHYIYKPCIAARRRQVVLMTDHDDRYTQRRNDEPHSLPCGSVLLQKDIDHLTSPTVFQGCDLDSSRWPSTLTPPPPPPPGAGPRHPSRRASWRGSRPGAWRRGCRSRRRTRGRGRAGGWWASRRTP